MAKTFGRSCWRQSTLVNLHDEEELRVIEELQLVSIDIEATRSKLTGLEERHARLRGLVKPKIETKNA